MKNRKVAIPREPRRYESYDPGPYFLKCIAGVEWYLKRGGIVLGEADPVITDFIIRSRLEIPVALCL